MNIDFTARRVRLSPVVKEIVEKKLVKLARVLPADAQAHVVVYGEKKGVGVEVTIVGRQGAWTATEVAADQGTAAHLVLDRIVAQAKKTKAKVKEEKKHRPSGVRSPEVWAKPEAKAAPSNGRARAAATTTATGPRAEPIRARPMFEEDALHAFSGSNREVLVYRDPADEGLRVLYRRRDGGLGLLVPV